MLRSPAAICCGISHQSGEAGGLASQQCAEIVQVVANVLLLTPGAGAGGFDRVAVNDEIVAGVETGTDQRIIDRLKQLTQFGGGDFLVILDRDGTPSRRARGSTSVMAARVFAIVCSIVP